MSAKSGTHGVEDSSGNGTVPGSDDNTGSMPWQDASNILPSPDHPKHSEEVEEYLDLLAGNGYSTYPDPDEELSPTEEQLLLHDLLYTTFLTTRTEAVSSKGEESKITECPIRVDSAFPGSACCQSCYSKRVELFRLEIRCVCECNSFAMIRVSQNVLHELEEAEGDEKDPVSSLYSLILPTIFELNAAVVFVGHDYTSFLTGPYESRNLIPGLVEKGIAHMVILRGNDELESGVLYDSFIKEESPDPSVNIVSLTESDESILEPTMSNNVQDYLAVGSNLVFAPNTSEEAKTQFLAELSELIENIEVNLGVDSTDDTDSDMSDSSFAQDVSDGDELDMD